MTRIAALAQMGGLGNPLVIFLIPILLGILVGGPLLALAGIVLAWRRRDSPFWGARAPRWLGAYAFAGNTAFISYLVATSTFAPTRIFEWPARTAMGLGLLAMIAGVAPLMVTRGARRGAAPWLVVIAALVTLAGRAERESWRRQAREDLVNAARAGDLETVQAAIDGGLGEAMRGQMLADATRGWNPQPGIAELLLRAGADPHARDERGESSWHRAVFTRHVELIRVFLAHGADPNASWDGMTPASLAWSFGDRELLGLLRRAGARDADAHEAAFRSLVEAARRGDLAKGRVLQEAGVPWGHAGPGGSDVLVAAAEEGRTEFLRLFIAPSGNPPSPHTEAALIAAAGRGQEEAVAFLVAACRWDHSAKVAADKAADAAEGAGHPDIARLIRSRTDTK